jgi:hypothetical protein
MEMAKESLVAKLREAGYVIEEIVRMGDNDGWRLALAKGAIIHSFDDGRCIVHGPDAAALRLIVEAQIRRGRACSAGPLPAFHLF